MTISDLGSIGEFVSSIAVVLSLLYLAFQVRQNTSQMKRAEMNATYEQSNATRQALLDESIAELAVKTNESPGELTPAELIRMDALMNMAMWNNYNIWDRVKAGVMEPRHWETIKVALDSGSNDFSRSWWESNKWQFDSSFVDEVDGLLDDGN